MYSMTTKKLLASWDIVAGASRRVSFRDVFDTRIDGRIAYLTRILLVSVFTPTFTTNPGVVGHNKLFKSVRFMPYGQQLTRGNLTGNALRMFERMEGGGHRDAEAIQTASASPRHWVREINTAPLNMAQPEEFAICCGAALDGTLEADFGALTDISADTTVVSGTVYVVGEFMQRDDLQIAPVYERREEVVASGEAVIGESLVVCQGLANSTAYDAIAAGDYSAITVEAGTFNPVNNVKAQLLNASFRRDFHMGELAGIQGEPWDATDVHQRQVNLASPTAIAAQTADLQIVMHSPPDQKISKLLRVATQLKTTWTGSQVATGNVKLTGRILPQSATTVQELADKACSALGIVAGKAQAKTISKRQLNSPYAKYFPYAAKVARAR